MKILNATPWPAPDATLLPSVLCTDRGFWQQSIDPAAGNVLPGGAAIPEIDTARLKAVCGKAISSGNSTIIFDIESAALALNGAPPDLFADRVAQYMKIVDLAHSFGVKLVSGWGFPFTENAAGNYVSSLAVWEGNDLALKPLLSKFDFLTPSIYSTDMDLANWEDEAAAVIDICHVDFPGKPVWPVVCARGGMEGTDGHYEDKTLFYRRLVFLHGMKIAGLVYWDANFGNPPTAFQTLDQMPFYNMLHMAALYDPIWPPDAPGWLAN